MQLWKEEGGSFVEERGFPKNRFEKGKLEELDPERQLIDGCPDENWHLFFIITLLKIYYL